MTQESSQASMNAATRTRSRFSGHGAAKGAAGYVSPNASQASKYDFLGKIGESMSISPPEGGFDEIHIGAAWDPTEEESKGLLGRLFKRKKKNEVDLDLGCLYELKDGTRGAVQAFGNLFGARDEPPYIQLSGDEKTGDTEGEDEVIKINGDNWDRISNLLIYVYIYGGAIDWAQVRPQIHIRIPGEKPMVVTLDTHHKELPLCVIAGIENVRKGLKITNYAEYYPGHAEMDRAFGYGLEWDDGRKST